MAELASSTINDTNNNSNLREALINTAVKFLQNPKVTSSPLKQKQQFLLSKGLTNDEVKRAFELASLTPPDNNQFDFNTPVNIPLPNPVHPHYLAYQPTLFYKIKEVFNVTALIGTTLYCVYWFYKRFIEPLLFDRRKKNKSIDDDDRKNLEEMKESITKVEEGVNKLVCNHMPDPSIPHLVQELKHDLASLKGLLLSRKQFPSAPPSIPAWQLEPPNQSREKVVEREDDAASGSSTNNSDSSLEMIREEPPK